MIKITISDNENFASNLIEEYLANGMGAMPKREFDILMMNLFLTYGGIEGRGNQDLSILLQTPEATIKRLRYEARLKYPPNEDYVKKEFLIVLYRSQFDFDKRDETNIYKMKISFIMEDDYLRHEIQGRLKAKGMFADTSFNSEIVKIECGSLISVIREFYGDKIADNFHDIFTEMTEPTDEEKIAALKSSVRKFVLDTAILLFNTVVVAEFKTRIGIP